MENKKEPGFAFEKKLAVNEQHAKPKDLIREIEMLFVCMKDTNNKYGVVCEFFRLDFRPPNVHDIETFPRGSFVLDLKWGSKRELDKKET